MNSKLVDIFGENITIYRENVKAGFEEPAFFVPSSSIKSKPLLNKVYNIVYSCQVIYFPRPNHVNDDIESTELDLTFNFLDLQDYTVHNREFTKSDDALVFTFDIYGWVNPNKEGTKMKNLAN
ncbi:phage tail terminator family protein [Apilactobacillus timberlakei]|uniref:phage tail terminator family protein n=1 Tax=Apilactobacillus timberlakei TaxID=2008380 RepID=UPI0034DAFEC0